jgi:putative SOS response-associated peptidase YedK
MCGRFAIARPAARIQAELEVDRWPDADDYLPGYNVAPTRRTPVLLPGEQPEIRLLRWGLIPRWARSPDIGSRLINARAETVTEMPAFRGLVQRHRCAVIAEGYYEWQRHGTRKQPHYIHPPDDALILFAGLWDCWRPPAGPEVCSYTVITTAPAPDLAAIHDRMPAILNAADLAVWLDVAAETETAAIGRLRPYRGPLRADPVSTVVNNVRHDGPECRERLADTGDAEPWQGRLDADW